jgi:integrase/recombinase XerD
MATLKLILDTRRKKANGYFPLAFRLTHNTQSTTIPTNLSLGLTDWDSKKQKVRKSHPNADNLNHELTKLLVGYQGKLISIQPSQAQTLSALKNTICGKTVEVVKPGFFEFAVAEVENLRSTDKIGNAIVYKCAVNSLKAFVKNHELKFEQLDYKLLLAYETHLLKKGLKTNSLANYMRTIRAIFNKAIKTNVIGLEYYPFKNYSIKHERTIAKVLSLDDFQKINMMILDPSSPEYLARTVFNLTFNLIGISFADLATLRPSNIVDGRIVYRRKKTKRIYSIKLTHQALDILSFFSSSNPNSPYLVPLLDKTEVSPEAEKRAVQLRLKTCNKYLKRIGERLEIDLELTTYVARYTWATTAKRMGYSNEVIAEALGHEYGNAVTSTYLNGFNQNVVDGANECLSNLMFPVMA